MTRSWALNREKECKSLDEYMGQRLCYLVTWSILDGGQEGPFKYMNCCPSFPIILNIVAPLSPILTPFYPSFLPRLPLIDTPLSFLVFPSFHLVFPAFPSPVVLHRLLGSGESSGLLLACTIGEVGRRGFRRAPVNSNTSPHRCSPPILQIASGCRSH